MKITVITSPFGCVPPHAIGAVEKIWYDLGKEFAVQGNTVEFIAKKPVDLSEGVAFRDGMTIKHIKGFSRKKSFALDLMFDLLYSLKALFILDKTDVLVLNTFWSPLLLFLFRKKYKVSVYNVARFPKGQFKYYRNIDRFACVSTAVEKELLAQVPHLTEKIKTIANPIDTSVFRYTEPDVKYNNTILYAGRVHPEKGVHVLADAFSRICAIFPNLEISLKIIGATAIEDGGGGEDYVNNIIAKAGDNKVEFIPAIYNPVFLAEAMSQCSIFCYPSLAEKGETFGVSPLEAMALGRATIVSNLDCFKDFVEDGDNAMVFDHRINTVDNLVSSLTSLLVNNDFKHKIAEKAATDTKLFSKENIADLYIKDFSILLQN